MSKVIVIAGPAGAGKSTTSRSFTDSAEGIWAYISQDDIRHFIKAGFADPTKPWDDETHKQWELSQVICADLLRRYQDAGINCVLDCFAARGTFDKWEKALEGVNYKLIILLPDMEITLERNKQRPDDEVIKESAVREHHEWHSEWKTDKRANVIDTTNLTVKQVIEEIEKLTK